jgi:hypothetical protein
VNIAAVDSACNKEAFVRLHVPRPGHTNCPGGRIGGEIVPDSSSMPGLRSHQHVVRPWLLYTAHPEARNGTNSFYGTLPTGWLSSALRSQRNS